MCVMCLAADVLDAEYLKANQDSSAVLRVIRRVWNVLPPIDDADLEQEHAYLYCGLYKVC